MKYKLYDLKGRENENMFRISYVKWIDRLINISGFQYNNRLFVCKENYKYQIKYIYIY